MTTTMFDYFLPTGKSKKEIMFDLEVRRTKSPVKPKSLLKTKKRKRFEENQYTLDFGQKNEVQCAECGMLYCIGSPTDEITHEKYHKAMGAPMTFKKMKSDNVLYQRSEEEYIVSFEGADHSKKRIADIREFVDKQLGFASNMTSRNEKTYLYISKKKFVGCIVVEGIQEAFRVVKNETDDDSSVIIGNKPELVVVGVSRIWVHPSYRRQNIASTLMDTMRSDFAYGSFLPKNLCALSQPTPDGKRFARRYFDTDTFLVYKYDP